MEPNSVGESVAPVLTALASDANTNTDCESTGNQSDECATSTPDQLPPLDACNSSSQRVISSGAATAREPHVTGLLETSVVEDEATADVHGRTTSADAVLTHANDRYSSSRSLVGAFDSSHQWQWPATAEDAHAASPRVLPLLTEATTTALSDLTVSPRLLEATTEATVSQEHEQLERRHSKQSGRANAVVSHATLVEIQAFLTAKVRSSVTPTPTPSPWPDHLLLTDVSRLLLLGADPREPAQHPRDPRV